MDKLAPSETFIRRELEQLRRRNWPIFSRLLSDGSDRLAFALLSCPEGFRLRFFKVATARVARELYHSPVTALRIIKRLPQASSLVKKTLECESRLIHSQFAGITADLASIAAKTLGINWTCSVHASDIYTTRPSLTLRRLDSVAAIAACSQQVADATAAAGIPATKIHLIHHGLPLNDFQLNTIRPEEFIFTACRLDNKKGIDTLLKACAVLAERGINMPCIIAGAGPDEFKLKKLRGMLNLNDHVFFKGWLSQEETRAYIRNAILTVLPSRRTVKDDRDGIANILVESLALGTPVITTTAGAAEEFIQSGVNGVLVKPDDHLELAEAMAKTLESKQLRNQFIHAGRHTAERLFDGAANIQLLESFFEQAVYTTE